MSKEIHFQRKSEVLKRFRFSKSTLANRINEGTFLPNCSMGLRSVVWISHELDAMAAAIASGKSNDEIKQLVSSLVKQRQELS
tara:strand:- start:271 stop:519 length:249 start_codon:yes stop_codon:yes gene_type:complete